MSDWHYGIDFGLGDDVGVEVVYERPSKWRRFLRRIKLDRSTWEFRVKHRHLLPREVFKGPGDHLDG